MKIVDVRVLGVRVNHRGNWIFVQVETDDGTVGLGEASHSGDDVALTAPAEPISYGELIVPQSPGLGATLAPALMEEHGFDPGVA